MRISSLTRVWMFVPSSWFPLSAKGKLYDYHYQRSFDAWRTNHHAGERT